MSIQFKNRSDEPKLADLDFRLRFLIRLADDWMGRALYPVVLITDIDTPGIHMEGSPHYDHRGVDLSIRSCGLAAAEEFATWINGVLDYGRGHNCVVTGKFDPSHRHDDHIHLQVPGPYRRDGRIAL